MGPSNRASAQALGNACVNIAKVHFKGTLCCSAMVARNT